MLRELLNLIAFFIGLSPLNDPDLVEIHRNVVYKQVENQELRVDIMLPRAAEEPFPVVLILHGGMWVGGSKSNYPALRRYLAQDGIATVSVEYGKWITYGYYGQVMDVKDAIRWVRRSAEKYNFDPERIGLFGSSAGGHLAALAAYAGDGEGFGSDPEGESSEVSALFLLYGVYDLNGILDNPLVSSLAGGFRPDDVPAVYEFFSPINHIDGSEPPTYVMHGTADKMVPVSQAENLVEALRSVDVSVIFTRIWDGPHGFSKMIPRMRPVTFETISHFFATELK